MSPGPGDLEGCRWVAPREPVGLRRLLPPVARQHDRSDCGPAALLTVLRYWGGDAPLPLLRDLCGTDLRGTGMVALAGAAGAIGISARGATGTLEDLSRERLPAIAHISAEDGTPHYVVVHRIGRRRVLVADPARGRIRISRPRFEGLWRSRTVLLLAPGERILGHAPPGWLPWVLRRLRAEEGWLVQSIFLGAVSAALGLAISLFVRWLVDRFIPTGNTGMILATGALLLAILLLRSLAAHLRILFLLGVHRRVSARLHEATLARLLRLPMRFFETRATGDLTTRLSDSVRLQTAVLEIAGTVVIDGMVLAGSIAFLAWLAPPLAWWVMGLLPIQLLLLSLAIRRVRDAQREALGAWNSAEASIIDTLRGASAVVSFGAAPAFGRANGELHQRFQERSERLGRSEALLDLVVEGTGGVLLVVALVHGAWLVVDGRLQVGDLMASYALLAGFLPSLHRLVRAAGAFQEAEMSAARVRDLLLAPPEEAGGDRPFRLRRELRMRQVSVIRPSGACTLREIELLLRPGSRTGIWGPSGAGKSTLLSLLAREHTPTAGEILLDGHPASHHDLGGWRRAVATFPGEVHLFRGTLADNVLLGRTLPGPEPGAPSDLTLLRRLEALGFKGFLSRFPAGWGTVVGEGGHRLSTGERQVVGLLRALASDPQLLLVDEGPSGTDAELQELLLRILLPPDRERTVVIVSHDPRILVRMDRILVLDGGRILLGGPPAEVSRRDPRMARLLEAHLSSESAPHPPAPLGALSDPPTPVAPRVTAHSHSHRPGAPDATAS